MDLHLRRASGYAAEAHHSSMSFHRYHLARPRIRRGALRQGNSLCCPSATSVRGGRDESYQEGPFPLYVALEKDVMLSALSLAYGEALESGLKAMKAIGVSGISVDLHWGLVEGSEPGLYTWAGYGNLLRLISDYGFKIKVALCFHGSDAIPLPQWVLEEGRINPELYYCDKSGNRSKECLSLGIDDVPVLRGRTAVDVYGAFMRSFREEFGHLFGNTITECVIGLGPNCELKYPSHPDNRWTYPGVGEFQCYDKFMLATLKACADQASQPSWGLGGPHDAGSYCLWPHQTGFFHQHGSWSTPYGKFFLQWYSEMLSRHADKVLEAARDSFDGCPLRLAVRVPGNDWWFNTASHGPELTAGYYNAGLRDGYLPLFKALSRHNVALRLTCAELRTREQPQQAFCDPERLLMQQRTAAGSLHIPVTVENRVLRFDEPAMQRIESVLFDNVISHSIELPQPSGLMFHSMSDAMFQPGNWQSFKSFVVRVRERAEEVARPDWPWISIEASQQSKGTQLRGRPVFA